MRQTNHVRERWEDAVNEQRSYWGLFLVVLIVALGIIGAGYAVGHSTYLAPYQIISNVQEQHYIAASKPGDTTSYLRFKGDNSVYLVPSTQLTPKFSAKSFIKTSRFTLTILPDSIGNVDIRVSRTLELKGAAFRVVALSVTTGKKTAVYATPEYKDSPDGYPHDQVAAGNQVTSAGVGVLALFVILAGMFGRSAPISDTIDLPLPRIPELLFGLVAGIFFIAFSFPVGVSKLGKATGWAVIQDVGAAAKSVDTTLLGTSSIQQTMSFGNLWQAFLIALLAYLVVLAVLSLRYWRLDLFGLGVAFLAIGALWLHLVTWLISMVLWLLGEILAFFGWLGSILAPIARWLLNLFGAIFGFLGRVLHALLELIFTHGWWTVIVVVLGIGLVYLAVKYRHELLEILKELTPLWVAVLVVAAAVGLIVLLTKLLAFLLPLLISILTFLGRIFAFMRSILPLLIIGAFILWVIYGLGALLLDQFKGAWNSGAGRRGVILGSLAIGISIALILLETSLYGATRYFPSAVTTFAAANIHQSNPVFDLLIALAVVAISILALLRNLPELRVEPEFEEFQTGVTVTLIALPLIGLALAYAATHTEMSS